MHRQKTAMETSASFPVLAVAIGSAVAFRGAEASAIGKRPVDGPVAIGPEGLAGDQQADRVHHGGHDKAIHHYPLDHYRYWRGILGDHPLLEAPGGFGENISTEGLTEDNVWLGDRFRLGTALVEVSHGRQPCWKIGHRFGHPALTARVVETGRAGWYYRVVEPGEVRAGDRMERVAGGLADWPLARLFAVLVSGAAPRDPAMLRDLAGLEVLAEAWRWRARELLG